MCGGEQTQHSAKGRDTQEERKKQAAAKELDMRRSRFIADMSVRNRLYSVGGAFTHLPVFLCSTRSGRL
jgi:hypothetical protein